MTVLKTVFAFEIPNKLTEKFWYNYKGTTCEVRSPHSNWKTDSEVVVNDCVGVTTVWRCARGEWVAGHQYPSVGGGDRCVSAHAHGSPVANLGYGAPQQHPRLWQRRLYRQGVGHPHRPVSTDAIRYSMSAVCCWFMFSLLIVKLLNFPAVWFSSSKEVQVGFQVQLIPDCPQNLMAQKLQITHSAVNL